MVMKELVTQCNSVAHWCVLIRRDIRLWHTHTILVDLLSGSKILNISSFASNMLVWQHLSPLSQHVFNDLTDVFGFDYFNICHLSSVLHLPPADPHRSGSSRRSHLLPEGCGEWCHFLFICSPSHRLTACTQEHHDQPFVTCKVNVNGWFWQMECGGLQHTFWMILLHLLIGCVHTHNVS